MTKPTAERYALAAAGVVIVALTVGAFWLSYAHLAEVAGQHGLGGFPARQWAWPATLDAFIVAGELLMLRAGLRQATDRWAVVITAMGSVGSIALNVAGVNGTGTGPVPFLDYVVAAVPPTAALLAFGVLMRQIHHHVAAPEHDHERAADDSHKHGYGLPAGLEVPRSHPTATTSRQDEPDRRHTTSGARLRPATEAAAPEPPVPPEPKGDVAKPPEQVAEARTKPEKPGGRKAAAPADILLAIGRTAPLGRDGRVSRRKVEDAIRAQRLPIGRERLDKITRRLQDELDEAGTSQA